MKLFLSGGGCGEQTIDAMREFENLLDKNKPLLYIPLAMEQEKYDSCLEWFSKEVKSINITHIHMVRSIEELEIKELNDYCGIFIGGGNTYKLLNDFKKSKAYSNIKDFINNGGVIFGGSAGAIIFGEDIDTCKMSDNKDVIEIENTKGYNFLNNISLLCHYKDGQEKTKKNIEYLKDYSKNRKILYLPEEDTIFINDNKEVIIGKKNYCIVENGNVIIVDLESTNNV